MMEISDNIHNYRMFAVVLIGLDNHGPAIKCFSLHDCRSTKTRLIASLGSLSEHDEKMRILQVRQKPGHNVRVQ